MQNKFPKSCAKCNELVPAYQGVCEKVGKQWVVEHVACHTPDFQVDVQVNLVVKPTTPSIEHPAWVSIDHFDYGQA